MENIEKIKNMAAILILPLLVFAFIARFLESSKNIIWLALSWFFLAVLTDIFWTDDGNLLIILIKAPLVYLWLLLVHRFNDSVFMSLLIVLLGGILLSLF